MKPSPADARRARKQVMAAEDVPDWLADRIAATRMDPRHVALND
ncbi:MAG: hypothetical protein ACKO1J_16600 [Tagaea sp.]